MTTLQAKDLSIADVHQRLGFRRQYGRSFTPLLTLESVTEFEQQELAQIRDNFDQYLIEGKVLEGMVKLLTVFPLLWLTGYYRPPIKLRLEESIDRIHIEDEDTNITGRFDLLAVHSASPTEPVFWVLIVEAKNSEVEARAGLAQLLTYAYSGLQHQPSVWGLTTNGLSYQFVYIQGGDSPAYQLMPVLTLMEPEPSTQLVQVLKAICKGS